MKEKIAEYMRYLADEEKSQATKTQYYRDILCFFDFLGNHPVTKEKVIQYKEKLLKEYRPASVNTKLAAINSFFSFLGKPMLRVKQLKIQKKPFCSAEKELSKNEYMRLIAAANYEGNEKLALLIQTICGTGIRVSELCFITVEAVMSGEAMICLKGKNRVILISGKLRKMLQRYIRQNKLHSGPVFVTRSGRPLNRSCIWKMMKALCQRADVNPEKVFPHNLRHLFARCFYSLSKDIAQLADVLGHSSINTARIYITSFGYEHRKQMEATGLVLF